MADHPTVPTPIDLLTAAIGPMCAFHVAKCSKGRGYIVIVDGAIHSACTAMWEANEVLGRIMEDRYGESRTPPEHAVDVTEDAPLPDPLPRVVQPPAMRSWPETDEPQSEYAAGPADDGAGKRMRSTVRMLLVALAGALQSIIGV